MRGFRKLFLVEKVNPASTNRRCQWQRRMQKQTGAKHATNLVIYLFDAKQLTILIKCVHRWIQNN